MIQIDIKMPERCDNSCPFFLGCPSPKDFPFVKCKFIGNLGSMFNQTARPIECPLVEVKEGDTE